MLVRKGLAQLCILGWRHVLKIEVCVSSRVGCIVTWRKETRRDAGCHWLLVCVFKGCSCVRMWIPRPALGKTPRSFWSWLPLGEQNWERC